MKINRRRLGILIVFIIVMVLGATLVALSYSNIGLAGIIGMEEATLMASDLADVPEGVVEDAQQLAMELFGDSEEKYEDFVSQLLAIYVEAKDKDFIVVFNSGGWGWNFLENSPGWRSIFDGIESELDKLGYTSLMLDYRRTEENLRGTIDEGVEMVTRYPSKAKNLARRMEFLTGHIPDLKVIIAGESDGTVISDSTMHLLRDNPRVYSIQTGPPFWHQNVVRERTLVLEDNGMHPDSFSQGDLPTMVVASIKELMGIPQPEENSGRILSFLRAPGHDYRWRYPAVYTKVTGFLENNFSSSENKYK